jgi:uncharacterized OsmC-like protein
MYSVAVENNGNMKFHATTRDSTFVMGINGGGANPVDTMLAGLCGCVGHYVRDFLTKRNIPCARFTLNGEARQTADQTSLSAIDLFLDLKGATLLEEEEETLLKHVAKCKVHNTLKAGCDVRLMLV